MSRLRSALTLTAVAMVTAGVVLLWALRYPFLHHRWDKRLRWRDFILAAWARALLKIMRIKVRQKGRPPEGGGLLISNHLSYIDILLLGATGGGSFVAKSEIRDWPFFGQLCRVGEVIFVERGIKRDIPRVIKEIHRRLDAGSRVLLFPEGTSTGGDEVAPFRPSLLAPAAEGGIPVHWAALDYRTYDRDPPAKDVVCWWGGMEFGSHVRRLMGMRGFEASVYFGAEPVIDHDRKRLASRLAAAVGPAFEELKNPATESDQERSRKR